MAKKVYIHDRDARGQVQILEVHKPKGAQKKSAAAGPIPWSAAPTTVAGKLKRAWIG